MAARRVVKKGQELRRPGITKCSPERKAVIIKCLRKNWSVAAAAQAAGIERSTAFDWKNADPEFAAQWDDALNWQGDLLEDEAHRRAVIGIDEPLTHQGHFTYARDEVTGELIRDAEGRPIPLTQKRYSDPLLMMLLKGRKPERYGDKKTATLALSQGEGADARKFEIEFVETS